MQINTFPCNVQPIHTTGVTVVSCQAIGYRDAYVIDDYGLLHLAQLDAVMFALFSSVDH